MSSGNVTYGQPGTRLRILQAATELVEQRGTALSLADVARAAGVSRQAIYLHFGDRSRLLVAVVEHLDTSLGLEKLIEHAFAAPTGAEVLARMMVLHAEFTPKIDAICQVLEPAQYEDEALGAAWRNRMTARLDIYRSIVRRVADDGRLADGWDVDSAAVLCYVLSMPGPWRELTRELGWSAEQYAKNLARFIESGIVAR